MQKIKSKWRAQKRKEGIGNVSRISPLADKDGGVDEVLSGNAEAQEMLPDESGSKEGEEDAMTPAQADSGAENVESDHEDGDDSENERYNAEDVGSRSRSYRRLFR